MSHTFLSERFAEDHVTRYFAVSEDKIEPLRSSQTYDDFGQKVGTDKTGDAITFSSQAAADLATKIAREQDEDAEAFAVGDNINGYDNADIFDSVEEAFGELKEGEDYALDYQEVKGFDYWSGSNWRTVVVEAEHYESRYAEVYDKKLIADLEKAIEDMELTEQRAGAKIYRGGNYQITESFWQGTWAEYELIPLDEIDY